MKLLPFVGLLFVLTSQQYTWTFAQDVVIMLPDTLAEPGSLISVPIKVGDLSGKDILSYQAILSFDENVLDAVGAESQGTLSASFGPATVNLNQVGIITVGGFGTVPLDGGGILLYLVFNAVGEPGSSTALSFNDFMFNAGNPPTVTNEGSITVTLSVPVELSAFYAEALKDAVMVTWLTESESDNFGFELQRSEDGSHFNPISFIKGHGTTTLPQRYRFRDDNVPSNRVFYRLKQIDLDGSFSLSKTVEVIIDLPARFALLPNFPNPFNSETVIEFETVRPENLTLKIHDLSGREVKTLVSRILEPGRHRYKWRGVDEHGDDVASAVYIYELRTSDFRQAQKMLLMR